MHVRLVAAGIDMVTILIEPGADDDIRVDVQLVQILRDKVAVGIVPGTLPDTAAGIDSTSAFGLCRQIRPPRLVAGAGGLPERLAVGVGPFQAAEVTAVSESLAGDEKCHVLRERSLRAGQRQQRCRQRTKCRFH